MATEFLEVLLFEVAGQRHGVDAGDVQELLGAMTMMPVPGSVPEVEGVINLRGAIVPVVDVRKRFGLPSKALALADHFIVVRAGDRLAALHVDRALELTRVEAAALTGVETLGARGAGHAQVAKLHDGMVLLHPIQDLVALVDAQGGAEAATPAARPSPVEVTPS